MCEKSSPNQVMHWQHAFAWLGGAICALIPYLESWEVSGIPVQQSAGHLGFNVMTISGLSLIGGTLAGYWWRACASFLQAAKLSLKTLAISSSLILLVGVLNLTVETIGNPSAIAVLSIMLVQLAYSISGGKLPQRKPVIWFRVERPVNSTFFGLAFLVMLTISLAQVGSLELSLGMKVSIFIGRFFTSALLTLLLFIILRLCERSLPKQFTWVPWIVLSPVPVIMIADQWTRMALGRRFIEFVNSSSSEFDLQVELAGGGLEISAFLAYLLVLGVFTATIALSYLCHKISRKTDLRISMLKTVVTALVCWLVVICEQAIGQTWKDESDWQTEYAAFLVHFGIISPPQGLAEFHIVFKENDSFQLDDNLAPLEEKPDIFIFMIESMRADTLRKDVAPFLTKWRETECQPFKQTWSASNSTHQSWFSFFHSESSVHWLNSLEEAKVTDDFSGAPALRLLKQKGYEIQVRAVCDLSYKEFGMLNFGKDIRIASKVVQADVSNNIFDDKSIPECEVVVFDQIKAELPQKSEGRIFFTALDSPHYNYYWHSDFKPPFDDYVEDASFPLNPSDELIQQYLRRYWNSCAWIDYQIKEFCDHLKLQSRYDDSIIILVGDHGEEFRERDGWCHCSSLQPEQTHVPILIKWRKKDGRGKAAPVASHLDVMPSLLSNLGVPKNERPDMRGKDLWTDTENQTAILTTAYAGKDGEAMIWRKKGYEAVFSWSHYWNCQVPEKVALERITGPDGKITAASPHEYLEILETQFPDAFQRFIESLEPIPR